MFQTKVVEKAKTHFLPRKSCHLWDNMEKYCRVRQPKDNNIAHAHCMLDILGCNQTLRRCITYCISTETVVERTPLCVMFYKHCLSWWRSWSSRPDALCCDWQQRSSGTAASVFCSGVPRNFVRGIQQIQLRTEGRENRDLGAVAPLVSGSAQFANEWNPYAY
jgi:hypothetical protein